MNHHHHHHNEAGANRHTSDAERVVLAYIDDPAGQRAPTPEEWDAWERETQAFLDAREAERQALGFTGPDGYRRWLQYVRAREHFDGVIYEGHLDP